MELPVLAHREQKDVFVLGGLDEILATLDESTLSIGTIASARHVGPIKSRVEEWQRMLALFGRTLDEWQSCQKSC